MECPEFNQNREPILSLLGMSLLSSVYLYIEL
jgi:hypothetical protein